MLFQFVSPSTVVANTQEGIRVTAAVITAAFPQVWPAEVIASETATKQPRTLLHTFLYI